jgi:hypothetical protein
MIRGLIVAGFLIGAAIALKVLSPEPIGPALASRLLGAVIGLVVVTYANDVPKALPSLATLRGDYAEDQAMRRFIGWSLTLGGLAYSAASLFAPLESANLLAMGLLAAALATSAVRVAIAIKGARA